MLNTVVFVMKNKPYKEHSPSWTLITGATQGIGEALVKHLSSNHSHLVIHYRNNLSKAEFLKDYCLSKNCQAEILFGDFSTKNTTQEFINSYQDEFNSTKCLINCVGDFLLLPLLETSLEQFNEIFQSNFFSSLALMQSLTPSLIKTKGKILNFGCSGMSTSAAQRHSPAYSFAKQALQNATTTFARELAKHHVCVNMISPGVLENSENLESVLPYLPFKQPGTLKDIVEAAAFLISKKSDYITGQNIEVSGAFRL